MSMVRCPGVLVWVFVLLALPRPAILFLRSINAHGCLESLANASDEAMKAQATKAQRRAKRTRMYLLVGQR